METESTNASKSVEIGLSTVMCFARERFQNTRRRKVPIKILRRNTSASVIMSDLFSALTISLNIYYVPIFFSESTVYGTTTSPEWLRKKVYK